MNGQALPWDWDPDLEGKLNSKPSERFPVSLVVSNFFWFAVLAFLSLSCPPTTPRFVDRITGLDSKHAICLPSVPRHGARLFVGYLYKGRKGML